jgi:hypothetical protein
LVVVGGSVNLLDQTRSGERIKALRGIVAPAAELAASDNKREAHCRSVAQEGKRRGRRSERDREVVRGLPSFQS